MNTKQINLASRPKGFPQLTDFRFELTDLPGLKEGEILVKPVYFSVDPYLRGRMNDAKSYIHAFQVDQPIESNAISTVLESKSENFREGDMVMGMLPWMEMAVVSDKGMQKVDATMQPLTQLAANRTKKIVFQ
jgi:hypothetical protein